MAPATNYINHFSNPTWYSLDDIYDKKTGRIDENKMLELKTKNISLREKCSLLFKKLFQ
jgi:hypothetical protein